MPACSVEPNGCICSIQFSFSVFILINLFCLFGNDEFYV